MSVSAGWRAHGARVHLLRIVGGLAVGSLPLRIGGGGRVQASASDRCGHTGRGEGGRETGGRETTVRGVGDEVGAGGGGRGDKEWALAERGQTWGGWGKRLKSTYPPSLSMSLSLLLHVSLPPSPCLSPSLSMSLSLPPSPCLSPSLCMSLSVSLHLSLSPPLRLSDSDRKSTRLNSSH